MGRLVKTPTIEVIPGTPTIPAAPPVNFHLFATPSPQGKAYRQKGSFPNQPAHFWQWSQMFDPGDWLDQTWYGPIKLMTYVTFPDVPVSPNGFPLVDGAPAVGYFDIPTLDGVERVTRTYYPTGRHGTYVPYGGAYTDPPFCTTGGPCAVVMFAGFPGRGPIPGTPEQQIPDYNEGWTDGARSERVVAGDCYTEFQVAIAAGGAVGLARAGRAVQSDPLNIDFAFYFDRREGVPTVSVMESGLIRRVLGAYEPESTLFRIQRVDGLVTYEVDGSVAFASAAFSTSPMVVGSSFYRAGDGVL